MSRYSQTCYYFEHYPHYMGTMQRSFKFKIAEMDKLVDRLEADPDDDDEVYDDLQELGDHFALGEVLRNWKEIRTKLERKGIWGDMWEEGSHAVSMQSMADARNTVGQIEIQVFAETGEW